MRFLQIDRKSTRLNSSHLGISYAVFCLKKKKMRIEAERPRYHPDHSRDEISAGLVFVRAAQGGASGCVPQVFLSPGFAFFFFFFNDTAPPEISPLPLHAPLPIWWFPSRRPSRPCSSSTGSPQRARACC